MADLAARRAAAHPDAEVIDLAGRLKRLAERRNVHMVRAQQLEKRISAMHPSSYQLTGKTSTQEEYKAHQDKIRPIEERVGLKRLRRRGGRMMNRLVRWTRQLAATEPATVAGLGAKAAAVLSVREADRFDYFTDDLAETVQRDAVRLAATQAEPSGDAELLSLIAQHGLLREQVRVADAAYMQADDAWLSVVPSAPMALHFRAGDLGGELGVLLADRDDDGVLRYGQRAVTKLEELPPLKRIAGKDAAGKHLFEVDPDAEARRAEILATWEAEKEALKGPAGLIAAAEAEHALNERLKPIEDEILETRPRTFEGLQAKARWIAAFFCMDREEETGEYAGIVLKDVCAMPAATALPVENIRPVPVDQIKFPLGRYPAGMPREVVESYRTFLDMDLRFLNAEVYGRIEGRLHYWLDNPAGAFHAGLQAPPSVRAAAVLGLFGLVPTEGVDGTPLPAASAA